MEACQGNVLAEQEQGLLDFHGHSSEFEVESRAELSPSLSNYKISTPQTYTTTKDTTKILSHTSTLHHHHHHQQQQQQQQTTPQYKMAPSYESDSGTDTEGRVKRVKQGRETSYCCCTKDSWIIACAITVVVILLMGNIYQALIYKEVSFRLIPRVV